jgi:hypothetical protein
MIELTDETKTVYFDLDDVLAHFFPYVNKACGTDYRIGESMDIVHWKQIRKDHQRIFRSLQPNLEAIHTLYRVLSLKNAPKVRLLTALPFDDQSPWQYASHDKHLWCAQHVIGIPMFVGPYAHDKKNHCQPGDLLIDDKDSNCHEWTEAGGASHLYRGDNEAVFKFIKDQCYE